jgi:DNA-binding Lrp family transcriptional regulator
MDGWWDDLDAEILDLLRSNGPMDPAELGKALGMSTDAVCSCLTLLAPSGRIRICSVECAAPRVAGQAA